MMEKTDRLRAKASPMAGIVGGFLTVLILAGCGGGETALSSATGETMATAMARKSPKGKPTSPPPTSTGSATISWSPPSINVDGSAAGDIAGFRIYYGTSSSDLSHSVDVSGPTASSYVVSGLGAGTYYFAVSAINLSGQASDRTGSVSTVIQ